MERLKPSITRVPQNRQRTVGYAQKSVRIVQIVIGVFILSCLFPGVQRKVTTSWDRGALSRETTLRRYDAARDRILQNIGPRVGAADGAVIASPSNGSTPDEPDYYYTWTRDSALTLSTLFPSIENPSQSYETESLFRSYIPLQASLQLLDTRSGDLRSGGLAEPKFMVDGSAFNGDWGRPQRDGPALRASALIPYAHFILDRGLPSDLAYFQNHLYDHGVIRDPGKVIKNDLEEVAHTWDQPGFDLWEEVNAHHLWTRVISRKALLEGAIIAARVEDYGAADFYTQQAERIFTSLDEFKDQSGIWHSSLGESSRTGLDCALPLTIIHQGDHSRHGSQPLSPGDPDVLATLRAYAKSFEGLYDINGNATWTEGMLLGRYAEDVYDGVSTSEGNPWFICTFSFAHALQLALNHYRAVQEMPADDLQSPFWKDVTDRHELFSRRREKVSLKVCGGRCFHAASQRLEKIIDSYLSLAERHMDPSGRMSEQIDRETGNLRGARDLTWSYASYMSFLAATDCKT